MTEAPRRTVLIVDDDIDFSESLSRLLALENYDVLRADSMASAVQAVSGHDMAVALVDIRLGSGNEGLDILRELRRINPDLMCLMITAYASMDTAIQALQAGAYDYLSKPFHSEDMLSTLDRCFERIQLLNAQKLNEVRMRQKQQMEAIGQLTSGIAHDFNNILAVLLSNLRLLEERMGTAYPQFSELVGEAVTATLTGSELTSRLMNFGARPDDQEQVIDLGEILPDFLVMLQRTLGKQWDARLDMPTQIDSFVGSRGLLETSLLNLALNARDAMQEGGTVTIKARNHHVGLASGDRGKHEIRGRFVAISVADTGAGMSDQVRARALEPLFTTKKRGDGNGLGLTMVDNFARTHGGWIGIESTPGQGTVMTLFLPGRLQA
ncbi:response regulator [Rhodobacteraceae bacterium F11138]|nr:response regulator [Rhodobacteraceae bacterium F11138]